MKRYSASLISIAGAVSCGYAIEAEDDAAATKAAHRLAFDQRKDLFGLHEKCGKGALGGDLIRPVNYGAGVRC